MLVCSLPCTTTYTLPPSQAPARALWAPRPSAGPWLCRPAAASRRPLRALAEGGVAEGGAGRVVVRGLPPAIDRRNVSALFSRFGNVTAAQLARGAPPGPPSRTGFVLFSDAEGARRAAEGLHGATVCDASVCSAIEVQPASGATHRLWSRIQAVRRDLQLRERLEGAAAPVAPAAARARRRAFQGSGVSRPAGAAGAGAGEDTAGEDTAGEAGEPPRAAPVMLDVLRRVQRLMPRGGLAPRGRARPPPSALRESAPRSARASQMRRPHRGRSGGSKGR